MLTEIKGATIVINQPALEAIRKADLTGKNFADLFEQMTKGTEGVGAFGGLLILDYTNQLPEEGELVPTITLALKPFTTK